MAGFGELTCPKCLEDASIQLNLSDMDTLKCDSCEEEFTVDNIRSILSKWQPFIQWFDSEWQPFVQWFDSAPKK